jgi:amino acid transporter
MSDTQLSRNLNRPVLLLYGVGTILGAGIYVLIGGVAGEAGSLALWSFVLASALAGMTAVSYAAFAPAIPEAAGEAAYVREAFGRPWLTTVVGLLLAMTGVVSAGVLARGFDGYLGEFVAVPGWLVISGVILVLGILAGCGVRMAAGVAVAITLIEVAGLLIVLLLTGSVWMELPGRLPELLIPQNSSDWLGIGTGMVLAFYAFIGFEDMVNMAEEAKDPQRDLPFAILGALLLASILYLLVGTAALLSLKPDVLAASEAPLAEVVRSQQGPAWLVSSISLVAVLNGALVQLIMSSRVLYGLARHGSLPDWLGVVSQKTRAPVRATVVITFVTLVVALALPIDRLAELTSLILLAVFAAVHAALLKLSDVRRRAKVSVAWPVVGLISCCGVIAFRLVRYLM